MRKIELSKGYVTTVDDEDYQWLSQYSWCWNNKYAMTHINGKGIYMHRFITDAQDGEYVDHIDNNYLNNSRSNLRICNNSENQLNTKKIIRENTTSKYKVVGKSKYGRFRVKICGKSLCMMDNEIAAANAYNYFAKKIYKDFPKLNDVPFMEKEEWIKHVTGSIGKAFSEFA
jgi:hypothetical protein